MACAVSYDKWLLQKEFFKFSLQQSVAAAQQNLLVAAVHHLCLEVSAGVCAPTPGESQSKQGVGVGETNRVAVSPEIRPDWRNGRVRTCPSISVRSVPGANGRAILEAT